MVTDTHSTDVLQHGGQVVWTRRRRQVESVHRELQIADGGGTELALFDLAVTEDEAQEEEVRRGLGNELDARRRQQLSNLVVGQQHPAGRDRGTRDVENDCRLNQRNRLH